MNWSAFFQGAPQGMMQGLDWSQKFQQAQRMNPELYKQQQLQNQQSQAMNPLLLQHQQLQNQGLGQNQQQSGQRFGQENSAMDAYTRMMQMQGGAGGGMGGGMGGGQPKMMGGGMPANQGMAPTATPMQGSGNAFMDAQNLHPDAIMGMPNPYGTQQQSMDTLPGGASMLPYNMVNPSAWGQDYRQGGNPLAGGWMGWGQ